MAVGTLACLALVEAIDGGACCAAVAMVVWAEWSEVVSVVIELVVGTEWVTEVCEDGVSSACRMVLGIVGDVGSGATVGMSLVLTEGLSGR